MHKLKEKEKKRKERGEYEAYLDIDQGIYVYVYSHTHAHTCAENMKQVSKFTPLLLLGWFSNDIYMQKRTYYENLPPDHPEFMQAPTLIYLHTKP